MEKPVKGDIIVFPFPFSDMTSQKRRPALVVATPDGNDVIVCQITSHKPADSLAIPLSSNDFNSGSLQTDSYIRPNKIISIDKKIIIYSIGSIKNEKIKNVIDTIIKILKK